jgi:hypothetical protein
MSDSQRSCIGFLALIAALGFAVLALLAGGVGSLVESFGGDAFGVDVRSGTIMGIGIFIFFFAISVYMFFTIRDLSWLPAILAGAYTILPDIILGPEDDILILILGGAISGFMAYKKNKLAQEEDE